MRLPVPIEFWSANSPTNNNFPAWHNSLMQWLENVQEREEPATEQKYKRDYLSKALREGRLARLYRAYSVDIEKEMMLAMAIYRRDLNSSKKEIALYNLKVFWRFLLRRYSCINAFRIWLIMCGKQEKVWSLQQFLNFLFPRLIAACALPALGLLTSKESKLALMKFSNLADTRWFVCLLLLGWFFWWVEVGRRMERDFVSTVRRSFGMTALTYVYSWCLCWLIPRLASPDKDLAGWPNAGWVEWSAACCAVTSHLAQLFWRDSSPGDPL